MQILTPTSEYTQPLCLALGFFDCVHIGHQALLREVRRQAEACGAKACAVTFSENPHAVLHTGEKLIFTYEERLHLLRENGMEHVLALPFDVRFMQMPPDRFLSFLTERFVVRGFVCGHDYRFGANAAGDIVYLRDFSKKNHIMCDIVAPIEQNGVRISSTRVRKKLAEGDLAGAEEQMGHAYFMQGEVCHGRGVGKLYDFPTANLRIGSEKLLPARGVYATITTVDGVRYTSVTNVGGKPTFGEREETVETLLKGFSGDLYGKKITVEFVRRLRDIRKFASPYDLKEQIYADAQWRE